MLLFFFFLRGFFQALYSDHCPNFSLTSFLVFLFFSLLLFFYYYYFYCYSL